MLKSAWFVSLSLPPVLPKSPAYDEIHMLDGQNTHCLIVKKSHVSSLNPHRSWLKHVKTPIFHG